jgi:ParB family transcriptional regulator, chromosome partitioning protein
LRPGAVTLRPALPRPRRQARPKAAIAGRRAAWLQPWGIRACLDLARADRRLVRAIQLVENCLRKDLKPVEQSKAYRALMDQNGWSIRQLAAELALDHTAVSRALKLLEMPESVQVQVERGDLSPWTAYEIAKVEDPAEQAELAARVVSEGLSRAETVEVVRQATGKGNKPARGKGRGASQVLRKVTSRVFRTTTGPRITVEFRKGLDDVLVLAALAEAMNRINVAHTTEDQSAA